MEAQKAARALENKNRMEAQQRAAEARTKAQAELQQNARESAAAARPEAQSNVPGNPGARIKPGPGTIQPGGTNTLKKVQKKIDQIPPTEKPVVVPPPRARRNRAISRPLWDRADASKFYQQSEASSTSSDRPRR